VLANDFARQLLGLPADFTGRPLRDVLPPGRLADVVTGAVEGTDLLVLQGDRVLAANRMPIWHERRRHLGWVITFQDRTESEALKRQLDDAIGLTDTLRAPVSDISEVLTVAGNLIDNAIDAAAQAPRPHWVELTIVAADHDLLIRVRDSGPGVPHDMREAIFMDGVTTKSSATGARRGLGLALVRQVVESRSGMISVGHDGGAVFTAVLPKCVGIIQETPHEKAPARP